MVPPRVRPFQPIFVVGNERSGTTLLATLLDRHPRIAATPETHLLYEHPAGGRGRSPGDHDGLLSQAFANPRLDDLELDRGRVEERFRAGPAGLAELFRVILEEYAGQRGKPRVAEKSPHHLLAVPTLLDWYPEARVLCIVRDGRDAVLSLQRMPWAADNIWGHAVVWRHLARLSLDYQQRYAARFRLVSFERLVADPASELTACMAFVGLSLDDGQLTTDGGEGAVPDWERAWKERALAPPDPGRIQAWKGEATPRERWILNHLMGPELQHLGYDDTRMEGCPRRLRALLATYGRLMELGYDPRRYPAFRRLNRALLERGIRVPWRA